MFFVQSGKHTESVKVLDESFFLAGNDAVVQISLPEDKDNQGNSKSQVSQPKYAKRKELRVD